MALLLPLLLASQAPLLAQARSPPSKAFPTTPTARLAFGGKISGSFPAKTGFASFPKLRLRGQKDAVRYGVLKKGGDSTVVSRCLAESRDYGEYLGTGVDVYRVSDGSTASVDELVNTSDKKRVLAAFFTQWGDFDSFEMAQRLKPLLPKLEQEGVQVVAIGIGSMEGAKVFAELTGFPAERLYVDETAESHKALKFAPGFGRRGEQPKKWWNSETVLGATETWSPYAKLLAMCAGLGSPGTLQEVFRGYLGDKNSPEIKERFPGVLPEWLPPLFGVIGEGYQRPFELATVRLLNMGNILTRWETLTPEDKDLILQRGGALIVENGKVVYRHDDLGILGYADVDKLARIALEGSETQMQEEASGV